MNLYSKLNKIIKKNHKIIILPESYDDRVLKAARIILKENLCKVVLIKKNNRIQLKKNKNLKIIDINSEHNYTRDYLSIRRKKKRDYTKDESFEDLKDPLVFGCVLLKKELETLLSQEVFIQSQMC
jgi:phosphotransacetylase